jgi:hypothetical protein
MLPPRLREGTRGGSEVAGIGAGSLDQPGDVPISDPVAIGVDQSKGPEPRVWQARASPIPGLPVRRPQLRA